MCAPRKDGEPWVFYAFRWLADQPKMLLALCGCAAAVGVYVDARHFFADQTQAFREVGEQLKELNVRVSHLEREHEAARRK